MAKRINLPGNTDRAIRAALASGDIGQMLYLQHNRYGALRMDAASDAAAEAAAKAAADAAAAAAKAAADKVAADAAAADKGFPESTPIAEMTAAQQAAYWKHQSRKHEQAYKDLGNVDELKQKAAERDEVVAKNQTEHDKQLEAVKKEAADAARAEERGKGAGELVKLSVTAGAAAKGIKAEDISKAVEFLDPTKFLTSDGTVDTTKVAEYVATLTPAKGKGPDTGGQGRRESSTGSSISAGRERFAERHGSKQSATT